MVLGRYVPLLSAFWLLVSNIFYSVVKILNCTAWYLPESFYSASTLLTASIASEMWPSRTQPLLSSRQPTMEPPKQNFHTTLQTPCVNMGPSQLPWF